MEFLHHQELIVPLSEPQRKFARTVIPTDMLPAIRAKHADQRVVLTSGVFDILHSGHSDLLATARDQGDLLVVGVNSDNSVRQLKGQERPIVNEQRRAQMIASMGMVDYVFLFEETDLTPYLELLKPDIYATSTKSMFPDKPEFIAAQSLGTSIYISQLRGDEDSTTSIVNRVLNQGFPDESISA